jgi:hypothetical protein
MLRDEELQYRAMELGVRLMKLTVSSWELIEPAQLLDGPYGPGKQTAADIAAVA